MSDPFEPEADRLEQEQEVVPSPGDDEEPGAGAAAGYPRTIPGDVPEADALEQAQEVDEGDDDRR